MKINRIKLRMILLIFITLIPLSILKFTEVTNQIDSRVEAEIVSSQDFAEAINLAFMNFLEKTWLSQYAMGNAIVTNPNLSNQEIDEYFKNIALVDKTFKETYWVNPQGIITTSLNPLAVNIDLNNREFIKEIISGKEKVIGNLEHSVIDGILIVPIARGIRVDGELKGIIINSIEASSMKDIIPINRIGEGSTFGLADRNATLVYRLGSGYMSMEERKASEDSPIRKALKGEIIKTYSRYSEFDGVERMGVDYPIDEIGWSIFVTTPVKELLAQNKQYFIKDIVLFILIYIGSFGIALVVASNFIMSIDKLKLAANKVIQGDLNVKTYINKEDDLYEVGQAFDNMIEELNKKGKEIEEYNNLKFQFLTNISHELKTPLNIILGCIQVLENIDTKNQQESQEILNKYIKMQKQNSYRLLRLINNFIDVNKIETNYIKIKLSNKDIIKTVEDITMSIVEYTKLKNINIIFDTDIEEKIIAFDVDMMERIILNLLSNSIKFTGKGGKIEVNIRDKEKEIFITVKDSGIGIPANKLDKIFDIFTQVDSSFRKRTEGSGVGLFLVKSLVDLHEGRIFVESEYGKGTQFTIVLPYKTIDDNLITGEEDISNIERISIEFSDIYI